MRITSDETVAVIVDVQERLFHYVREHERLAVNLVTLIRGLTVLGVPLLRTQQYTSGLGPTVSSVDGALAGVPVIEKISFSCCDEPAFTEALGQTGRKRVILAGIEAHVCVQQTAVDLLDAGYTPVVVEDCISSRKENDRRHALLRLQTEGIRLATYESILFELCRYAGNDRFREILGLIK
jgi:nicotinamidase-related amidase